VDLLPPVVCTRQSCKYDGYSIYFGCLNELFSLILVRLGGICLPQ
jgi:hypothetical protein